VPLGYKVRQLMFLSACSTSKTAGRGAKGPAGLLVSVLSKSVMQNKENRSTHYMRSLIDKDKRGVNMFSLQAIT
jgi:hypothetical protein